MFYVIYYQKKDGLSEIMFKLEEVNERLKFRKKEKIAFLVFALRCIFVIGIRVYFLYVSFVST